MSLDRWRLRPDTNTRGAREIPRFVAESPLANLPALRILSPAMPPPPSAKPSVVSTDLPSGAGHPVNDLVHPGKDGPRCLTRSFQCNRSKCPKRGFCVIACLRESASASRASPLDPRIAAHQLVASYSRIVRPEAAKRTEDVVAEGIGLSGCGRKFGGYGNVQHVTQI
jgi:hypothetical protein